MLTRQKAQLIKASLTKASREARVVFSALQARGKISANLAHKLKARVAKIAKVAFLAQKALISEVKTPRDVIKASKIEALDKLINNASEVSAQCRILSKLIAEADEFAELPNEVEAEDEIVDEVEAEDEIVDEVEAEDEIVDDLEADEIVDDLEADGIVDDLDAEDEIVDDLDAEDEIVDEPVVPTTARRRRPAVKASARQTRIADVWNFGKTGM